MRGGWWIGRLDFLHDCGVIASLRCPLVCALVLASCAGKDEAPAPGAAPAPGVAGTSTATATAAATSTSTSTATGAATPTGAAMGAGSTVPAMVDPAARFPLAIATLVGAASPPVVDAKAAWADYEAGRFAEAQRGFAAVALADTKAWKHPFNLACAAARGGNAELARVGLVEAVRRGGKAAVDKARRDADLASVRTEAWFEPVMRGEDPAPPAAPPTTAGAAPSIAAPVAPASSPSAPAEPDELPGFSGVSDTPIAGASLTTLKAKLVETHGVPVAIRGSLQLAAGPDGAREAYALYDFSRFAECVKTSNKKACRKQLTGDEEEDNQLECTDAFLVRASLAAAGTWEIRATKPLDLGCEVKRVLNLIALDLDHDGADEILLDVNGQHAYASVRDEINERVRIVQVFRLDGSTQLELRTEFTEAFMSSDGDAHRHYFADGNADGHADVVLQSVELRGEEAFAVNDELWSDDIAEDSPISTQLVPYDPVADAWPGVPARR